MLRLSALFLSHTCRDNDSVATPPGSPPAPDQENDNVTSSPAEGTRLPSTGDCNDLIDLQAGTPKHEERRLPLKSQSSIGSFTALAITRVENCEDKEQTEGVNDNGDASLENGALSPVFEEAKKPTKPLPVPRKGKSNVTPSLSSTAEATAECADETEKKEEKEEKAVTGDKDSSAPHAKPKPRPRVARKSESSAKGEEVTVSDSTPPHSNATTPTDDGKTG